MSRLVWGCKEEGRVFVVDVSKRLYISKKQEQEATGREERKEEGSVPKEKWRENVRKR